MAHITNKLSRRKFFRIGGAAVAGGSLSLIQGCGRSEGMIRKYRTLGRTGFKVSDIGFGTGRLRDPVLVRYAYDKGINYFDTGESYGRGASESAIGEALKNMDRTRIFITTKLNVSEKDTLETILERFQKCQERLNTGMIDALYLHNPSSREILNHSAFHEAVSRLKGDGKIRFIGVSCHGPQGPGSMAEILCAAAEDGRFDQMLLVYNFMNHEEGSRILDACRKNNVGTTAMKTAPGIFKAESFDPENLSSEQSEWLKRQVERGMSREQAVERLQNYQQGQRETYEKTLPFIEAHGIDSADHLRLAAIQWVLADKRMNTACVSMNSFDEIDKVVGISGTALTRSEADNLKQYAAAFSHRYCRHGCNLCSSACIHGLPVNDIMRFVYYYEFHGDQKSAMQEYRNLSKRNGSLCTDCTAPCLDACPHGFDAQIGLVRAHKMLTLA